MAARMIFITGTDTGVGKTVFTGLLLTHLRSKGFHALAMKPFCSGGLDDVEMLSVLQDRELTARQINPYYFPEPVAPLVAARNRRRIIKIDAVLQWIRTISERCEWLLVEGAGGLLTPLGEKFSAREIIVELKCRVVCVAANRLGTINHTLLTVKATQPAVKERLTVALMGVQDRDASVIENARILSELTAPGKVFEIPYFTELSKRSTKSGLLTRFKKISKKIEKTLAEFTD
jgi:dethiobiotin synthetase